MIPVNIYLWTKDGWMLFEGAAVPAALEERKIVIAPNARVGDRASVGEGARVGDRASVGEGASVERTANCIVLGPLGSRAAILTGWRDAKDGVRVSTGRFVGTLDEFAAAVARTHGTTEHAVRYGHAIAYLRAALGPAAAAPETKAKRVRARTKKEA